MEKPKWEINDEWTSAINTAVDMFMKILDWMWSLTLPGTNIPLYTIWIITFILGIVMALLKSNLSLAPTAQLTKSATGQMYKSASFLVTKSYKGGKAIKKGYATHKTKVNNNNKTRLSLLAKQAKTREQGYKRVHTTQRINKGE